MLELDRLTGDYVAVDKSGASAVTVAEAREAVEAATPRRAFAPDRVLAIKAARHRTDQDADRPEVTFEGLGEPSSGGEAVRDGDPGDADAFVDASVPGEKAWRFTAALDILDAVGLHRQAEALWGEHHVREVLLDRLLDAVVLEGGQEHRVLVYVVVEVVGESMVVERYEAVRPQCCCGEKLCAWQRPQRCRCAARTAGRSQLAGSVPGRKHLRSLLISGAISG